MNIRVLMKLCANPEKGVMKEDGTVDREKSEPVPNPCYKIELYGKFKPWVTAKDLALSIIGSIGDEGANCSCLGLNWQNY